MELVGFENPMQEKGIKKEVKNGNSTKKEQEQISKTFDRHRGGKEKPGKQKMKEMKEGRNEKRARDETVETIHTDAKTGRRYSYNGNTGATEWLTNEEDKKDKKEHKTTHVKHLKQYIWMPNQGVVAATMKRPVSPNGLPMREKEKEYLAHRLKKHDVEHRAIISCNV